MEMGGKFSRLVLFAHSVLSHLYFTRNLSMEISNLFCFPFAKCSAFASLKSSEFISSKNSFWIYSKTSLLEDFFSANFPALSPRYNASSFRLLVSQQPSYSAPFQIMMTFVSVCWHYLKIYHCSITFPGIYIFPRSMFDFYLCVYLFV